MRNKVAGFDKDVDGILERVLAEGASVKEIRLRESGRAAKEIRAAVREMALRVGIDVDEKSFRNEVAEMMGNLKNQYHEQLFDLARTGQVNENILSWERIDAEITPEVIVKALRIAKLGGQPYGLLVPDNDRHAKAEVIDRNPTRQDQAYINFVERDDKELWNGGRNWPRDRKWEYLIVDGAPEVRNDRTIRGNNYRRTKDWVEKYRKEDLDVLTGADPYLSLVRQNLLRGVPMDQKTFTVLNAENLQPGEELSNGDWISGEINLATYPPERSFGNLRVRACIKVI